MPNNRPLLVRALVIFAIGLFDLINEADKPGLAQLHKVDILHLLASGMCFGVALAFATARIWHSWER